MEGMRHGESKPDKKKASVKRIGRHFYWSLDREGGRSGVRNETSRKARGIEQNANYDGNETLSLFSRLRHPTIKRQIAELVAKGEQARGTVVRPIDVIEREIDERLVQLETSTPVTFDPDQMPEAGERELMNPRWRGYEIMMEGKRPTVRQLSMVEAHEKGHIIRPYDTEFFRSYFSPGFNKSAISFTQADYEKLVAIPGMKAMTFEQARSGMIKYLFSGEEIAERMSQLKNYFGMMGADQFTRDHLDWARQNYLEDMGFDNWMKFFFQAITNETADQFLQLINNSGI